MVFLQNRFFEPGDARGSFIPNGSGFPMKIGLLELLMGVETPIPPKMITTAAPDGAPPRRIKTVEKHLPIFMPWV
jgi:hypothetical protein